jgi:2,4-dienoyl-CoA reductase (NADPH2)
MTMSDPLFAPLSIGQMALKNRIYMPAMHMAMCVEHEVTDPLLAFYAARAKGGAGMICVGYATVDELAGNTQNIGAHHDRFLPGLARLAEVIKENGARAAIQLNHAGRYNYAFFIEGKQPIAPSPIASRLTRETPREMTAADIEGVIDSFAQAAARSKKAGFDAVEILSGTGYLISEFLSPLTNQRTDGYGGALENRMRFGLEVVAAVRRAVGPDYPLVVRMNGNDFMPGGNGREELQTYAAALDAAGVDALCINVGWHEAPVPQIVSSVPRGVFAYLARGIRERVTVPVIASHRINDPAVARDLLKDDMCDMVAMGRSLIADPQLPNKVQGGREQEIVHCIACAQGCFDNLFKLKSVECLCNPTAGHELECGPGTDCTPKKVLVVGGGPAGMSAAIAAHDRGHQVHLVEATDRLGGQLFLAAAPPGRGEFAQLAKDLARQVALRGIAVTLGRSVSPAVLDDLAPEAVILATGARPLAPPIPGAQGPKVVQAWDVLQDRVLTGRRVVVVGGGAVGVETALFLAAKGTLDGEAVKFLLVNRAESPETLYEMATRGTKAITVVEMIDKVGKDIGKSTRWSMLQEMGRHGVEALTGATALEITAKGVRIAVGEAERLVPADTVVMAAGSSPHNPLEAILTERGIPLRVVGDAGGVGLAFDAVHQGYAAGREI